MNVEVLLHSSVATLSRIPLLPVPAPTQFLALTAADIKAWHRRFGHLNRSSSGSMLKRCKDLGSVKSIANSFGEV
jgi:hypothetical protein